MSEIKLFEKRKVNYKKTIWNLVKFIGRVINNFVKLAAKILAYAFILYILDYMLKDNSLFIQIVFGVAFGVQLAFWDAKVEIN